MTDRILRTLTSLALLPSLVTFGAACSSSDDTIPSQTAAAGGTGGSAGAGGSSSPAGGHGGSTGGSAGTTTAGGHAGTTSAAGHAGTTSSTGGHAGTTSAGGNGGGAGTAGGGHDAGGSAGTTGGSAGTTGGNGGESGGSAGAGGDAQGGSAGTGAGGSGGMQGSGIGDPCTSMGMFDMGTCAKGQICITGFNFTDGYCSAQCDDMNACPDDAACTSVMGGGFALCFKACNTTADCRVPDYECAPAGVCVPVGSATGSGSDGTGVSPGTSASGGACVTPVVDPPGVGSSFGADFQVSMGTHEADTHLAVDPVSKHVMVVWTDVAKTGRKIGFALSADDGKTFGAQVELPADTTIDKNAQQASPSVAVDPSGEFFVSWLGYDTDPMNTSSVTASDLYVARLKNDGSVESLTFATPAGESAPVYTLDKPWIAADKDGTLFLAYDRTPNAASGTVDIRLVKSTDHGVTWSAPITISDSADRIGYDRDLPKLAAMPGGGVVATWIEIGSTPFGGTDNHVYTQLIAADGSKTGANALVTSDTDSPTFLDPSVAVDGTSVYVAFNSGTIDGDWDVRVAASLDGGLTYAPSVKANDDATCATHYLSQVAVDGSGAVHVVYIDNRYTVANVFHQSSAAPTALMPLVFGASTFVNSATFPFITDNSGKEWIGQYLGFAAVGSALYAAWPDPRSKTSHIFFARGGN